MLGSLVNTTLITATAGTAIATAAVNHRTGAALRDSMWDTTRMPSTTASRSDVMKA